MITADDAIRGLREVVRGHEDALYVRPGPRCVYAFEGKPSCLVGCVLHHLGWTLDRLSRLDEESFSGAGAIPMYYPDDIEEDAASVFSAAQTIQDCDGTWGDALASAEIRYKSVMSRTAVAS